MAAAAVAVAGWVWRWGWGRRCPGRPGLPGPGPGPTTLLLFLLFLGPVAADITDGNSEHLKREHSLIKPYHGEAWGGNEFRVRARLDGVGEGVPFFLVRAVMWVLCLWQSESWPGLLRTCLCPCLCPQGSVPAPRSSGTSKAAQCSRASTCV